MKKLLTILAIFFMASNVLAWNGYDYENDSYVEIAKGNLVRPGKEIEYYDYKSGEYKQGDVESIRTSHSSIEVEIYDHESGEYRTFEMDR